jgi:prepilin-type processing-associated H-X9-DG protein
MRPPSRRRRAFSLTELLVVIGGISVLAGILLPMLGVAREVGRRTKCMSNLRQFGLATDMYREDNRDWYPPVWTGRTRWMDLLKDYVGEPEVYDCPTSDHIPNPWDPDLVIAYGMNVYNFGGRCLWYGIQANEVQVPSRTILMADAANGKYYVGSGVRWQEPVQHVAYRHRGRFTAGFFDGHSESLLRTTKDQWALGRQLD